MDFILYKMGLEEGLRVILAVVACLDDGNFVVSLVVLAVDASCAIESDELIGGSSGLNLDYDGASVSVFVLIIGNANNLARPKPVGPGIDRNLRIVVPSDVPVLDIVGS